MHPEHPNKTQQPIKVIGEHKFYDVRNADQIPHTRFIVAEVQEIFIKMGISEAFLSEMMDELLNVALDGKRTPFEVKNDVTIIANNIKGRLGMLSERTAYEELACVYFMMDNEPMEYDKEFQQKKKSVWRDAGEQDFFTVLAFRITNNLQTISEKDILSALLAVSERVAQLPQLT